MTNTAPTFNATSQGMFTTTSGLTQRGLVVAEGKFATSGNYDKKLPGVNPSTTIGDVSADVFSEIVYLAWTLDDEELLVLEGYSRGHSSKLTHRGRLTLEYIDGIDTRSFPPSSECPLTRAILRRRVNRAWHRSNQRGDGERTNNDLYCPVCWDMQYVQNGRTTCAQGHVDKPGVTREAMERFQKERS